MQGKSQQVLRLLRQQEFKQWVLNPTEERDIYWKKWLEKNPEQYEAVLKARELLVRIRFKERNLKESEIDEMLSNIIARRSWYKPIRRREWRFARMAAALALSIATSYLIIRFGGVSEQEAHPETINNVVRNTPKGVKSQITLSDGSKIFLNSESRVQFPEKFGDSRIVELQGEAYFQVAKDSLRPFLVKSRNITTSVYGTSFNVNSYADDGTIQVALVEGKVSVKKGNGEPYMLNPGEKIIFDQNKGGEKVVKFDPFIETGWKNGALVFVNSSFGEFVTKLERWYGVDIDVVGAPKENWNVDGTFDNESLEEVLMGVSFTHNIRYAIQEKRATIIFN